MKLHAMCGNVILMALLAMLPLAAGCETTADPPEVTTGDPKEPVGPAVADASAGSDDANAEPCVVGPSTAAPQKIERFATGSPFDKEYKPPTVKEGKRMWAKSYLWTEAPKFVVEKWLTEKPEMKGKYLLIEFWATWCPPCRRSLKVLNGFHEKYGKDMVVIGVSDETEADVRKLKEPVIEFYSAIDTQARMKNELGVWGIPHAIIVEPGGFVIWEGFPLLKDYELTEEIIEKILAAGRRSGVLKSK